MYIDDWFQSLTKRIRAIEHEWPQATDFRKQELLSKLWELRQASDQVVDLWLQYEEKLSNVMKQIDQELSSESLMYSSMASPEKEEPHSAGKTEIGSTLVEFYQKGEGFYHLRLYEQARGYFEKLVEDAPDWETGRLYYAYSLLFCEETEAAFREFRLLSKSAASPSVSAISCNAIGCMLAKEGKWLEARQAYMESLSHQENQREAMYNLALTHLHDGEADEALEILDEYLTIAVDDWEAHIAWLHAAKMIASKETHWMRETPTRLQLPIRQLDCDTIREIAIYLEANGETFRAYNCYRELISQNPRNDWAWHGLAWNTWLIHGTQPALPMLKKAVSLAPANLDYLFSYGWLLLFDGDESSAARVFRFILAKDEQHSLALAGLIVASERLGEFAQAQRLASSLTQHKRSYLRALGYYQLGRLAAISERWPLAAHYFHQSVEEEEAIPEAKLFLELCSKQTEPHRAEKSKQDFQSSLTNMTIH